MKKILFSLVGKTDPISNYYDGPMLHLCRYFCPDIVYLYISAEFMQHHRKDDRYRETIRLLGDRIQHKFDVRVIERPYLEEVHIFDLFYDEFEKELRRICTEYKDDDIELAINLSQGTPAMKSALYVVAALADMDIQIIQVSSPEKKPTLHYDLPEEYSIQDYWDVDQDNHEQERWESATECEKKELKNPNRTFLAQNASFHMRIQKEIILKMIHAYDYAAALLVAEGIRNYVPDTAFTLLEAAQHRISLKQELCRKKLVSIGYGGLIPYHGADGQIYEYALLLSIKQQRQEYLDFIRGMTPLLFALSSLCVKKKLHIQIRSYCTERNGTLYLERSMMEQDEAGQELLNDIEKTRHRTYDTKFLSEDPLISLIQRRLDNDRVKEDFRLLYTIEKQIRNPAAHKVVAITEEDIKDITGRSSKDILDIFKRIIKYLGFSMEDMEWNSYQYMNQEIARWLNILP